MASKVYVLERLDRGKWKPVVSSVTKKRVEDHKRVITWMYGDERLRITTYVPQREAGRGVDR